MLILAGVSINAIVGDNGIVTMAMKAKELSKKATELEDLQMALVGYSASSYSNQPEALDSIVKGLFSKGYIDWVDGTQDNEGKYIDYNKYEDENGDSYVWVKKGENSYKIFLGSDDTYSAEEMSFVGGGTLKSGTYIVTKDAFSSATGVTDPNEKGKFTMDGEAKVMFKDPLGVESDGITASGEMLSIQVKSGSKAKIYFYSNEEKKASDGITYYKLTNEGLKRSAIDIESGAELSIYIGKNVCVTVDSGFGSEGATAAGDMVGGGMGGFAGIHVPKFSDYNYIENVEFDKVSKTDITKTNYVGSAILNIDGEGTLVCYGGRAGDGGNALSGVIGGGAGGGAGAGIGGNGGKGGNSGYGTSNGDVAGWISYAEDGEQGEDCGEININGSVKIYAYGGGGGGSNAVNLGADGGPGGQGGDITIDSTVTIEAYNGNKYTDGATGHENPMYDENLKETINGDNQCIIYAHNGIYLAYKVRLTNWSDAKNAYYSARLGKTISYTTKTTGNLSDMVTLREYNAEGCEHYTQGIGSGAGYLETSNGSFTQK